ncbi:uracil-DNA glycosylase family protein [Oceanibacterium hippocampi]|uniref:Uracil DNA glycosylase superfamily protein n=1 Tax=Oceanibacterium hippocampi TaxID=745714 RepID=A0A1Y5T651_9PROT|nr:uracil-DNA glycosylase family protein [Oceanibacterium hippocampi]SLN56778.1 Uracil DNA glycosylase superfamily protein [Oceanibacterium hippocampi]
MQDTDTLAGLVDDVRACRHCAATLPLGPRPVIRLAPGARIVIAGQAPGTKVHETGIPWNDASGERLRDWLDLDRERFYDESRIAIIPQGFCYPGRDPRGGDNPPRPECQALWHDRLFAALGPVPLLLAIGIYAQAYHLGPARKANMTETVRAFRDYLPSVIPLPHPSWRNTHWSRKNPWFESELLPVLKTRVREVLA